MENNTNPININTNYLRFFEDTIVYLQRTFDTFDISLLTIDTLNGEHFDIFYAHSYDNQNFSQYKTREEFELPDGFETNGVTNGATPIPIYISIFFKQIKTNPYTQISTLYPEKNVDSTHKYIQINSITYGAGSDIVEIENIRYQSFYNIINQYPRWNFYDNQKVSIDRWLAQCNSIAEMYGHSCIYFKTEPIESETIHTFANHVVRNVTNIKKINILAPNNELPQDRNIYSEWDMPLQDDFIIHIVREKFELAFGENIVPSEKDYLYLPIINKLFRVASMQPKNGFMGKIGWWEVFLAKYEEDDCVTIDDDLKSIMGGLPEFDDAIDSIDVLDDYEVLNQLNELKADTVNSKEKIVQLTVDEKKEPTQNFTNKLMDSNFYVALKETEKLREFYDKRLQIISVNPDESAFPITMYDNTTVDKRVIALQYNLSDYTIKNKLTLTVNKGFKLSFNFILMLRFVGELFDLIDDSGNFSQFTVKLNRSNLVLIDSRNQKTFDVNYKFSPKELYNVSIEYSTIQDQVQNQIIIKIFKLSNKEKTLEFQDVYMVGNTEQVNFPLSIVQMFGGNYLSSEIMLDINEKNILKDFVNPLLQMKQF